MRNLPEAQSIRLHGQEVCYRLSGNGPLMVLVHRITSTSETWREVIPKLAERFTVLAPHPLGHGIGAQRVVTAGLVERPTRVARAPE